MNNMIFFIVFIFFVLKVHSVSGRIGKCIFLFTPQRFGIFGQPSSLIVFIRKIKSFDNVKHEPALFQFRFLRSVPPFQL